jgi:DNA polymerase II small subunit/DNA polymerase delta subunit B
MIAHQSHYNALQASNAIELIKIYHGTNQELEISDFKNQKAG